MNLWTFLKDTLILFLADPETVYAGRGTYHWLNHEGRVILRSPQRIVGFGTGYLPIDEHTRRTNFQGIKNTISPEAAEDLYSQHKDAAHRQAKAYYRWYTTGE